uniref:HTH lysR-type domain-containing protein n=1 Tax=uncultured Thiotrichaceae bacterium TaxID=298394 RepID=A0A6S6U278_9GAMM|nr:MAG: Unknown protein [uncultured Thiotrichaceae bacterium]
MSIHSSFLRYFDEVCKSSSIRKAAAQLHVASSAVNRQILKVEDELGTKLFERSYDGIKLTEAGQLLAQHVSRTLHDADRTLREIDASISGTVGGLKFVSQGSVISRLLPPVLMRLYEEYPNTATSFIATGGKGLHKLVQNGSADIALIFDYKAEPGIELVDQISLPVGAVMAADHPLAMSELQQISMQACAEYSVILPDESWPLRDRLNRELSHTTIDSETAASSNSIEFLRAMLTEKKVVGFQTIIGLEEVLEEGSLVHIPLVSAEGGAVTQTLSVTLNENRQDSVFMDRALCLLRERLREYAMAE